MWYFVKYFQISIINERLVVWLFLGLFLLPFWWGVVGEGTKSASLLETVIRGMERD